MAVQADVERPAFRLGEIEELHHGGGRGSVSATDFHLVHAVGHLLFIFFDFDFVNREAGLFGHALNLTKQIEGHVLAHRVNRESADEAFEVERDLWFFIDHSLPHLGDALLADNTIAVGADAFKFAAGEQEGEKDE